MIRSSGVVRIAAEVAVRWISRGVHAQTHRCALQLIVPCIIFSLLLMGLSGMDLQVALGTVVWRGCYVTRTELFGGLNSVFVLILFLRNTSGVLANLLYLIQFVR